VLSVLPVRAVGAARVGQGYHVFLLPFSLSPLLPFLFFKPNDHHLRL